MMPTRTNPFGWFIAVDGQRIEYLGTLSVRVRTLARTILTNKQTIMRTKSIEKENALLDAKNIERTRKQFEALVCAGLSEQTAREFLMFYRK